MQFRNQLPLQIFGRFKDVSFIYQLNYIIPYGEYILFNVIHNREGKKVRINSRHLVSSFYDTERLKLSDIQITDEIREAEEGDIFVKNGLYIAPYPFIEVDNRKMQFICRGS